MKLAEVIEQRKSIREYKDKPVAGHLIEQIVKLAKRAPSAGAVRGYKVVVTDQQLVPYKAPVYFVVFAVPEKYGKRYGQRGRDLYAVQDATLVAGYIQLAAVSVGLDTVWVGAFNEGKVRTALDLPIEYRPIAVLPTGYRLNG